MSTQQQNVGLKKAKRKNLKKIYAVRVQPPDFQTDEEDKHKFLFYYISKNFKSKSSECSHHVWRRAEGRTGPGVVRDGLDTLSSRYDFILHEKKGTKTKAAQIVGVDLIPSTVYSAKGNAPSNMHDLARIQAAINLATGEVEFIEVPIGVTKPQLQMLISELDKVSEVNVGDTLGGTFHVYEIQGNRLFVDPPSKNAGPVRPGQVTF